jgi:hypothetical protein
MKQGQGFLLVFSITSMSSLNELAELREQIVRIKEDETCPIVIVGNKSDLEEDRTVSRSRAFALSQQWGNAPYYETSARRRANVNEVFIDLCRQIIRKDIQSNQEREKEHTVSKKKYRFGHHVDDEKGEVKAGLHHSINPCHTTTSHLFPFLPSLRFSLYTCSGFRGVTSCPPGLICFSLPGFLGMVSFSLRSLSSNLSSKCLEVSSICLPSFGDAADAALSGISVGIF